MTFTVRVLRRAQRDLQEIYDYLVIEAPARAGAYIDKLIAAIESLSTMPRRAATPRDPVLRARGYRVLAHEAHLIFFKVQDRQVRVHRVLRGSPALRGLL